MRAQAAAAHWRRSRAARRQCRQRACRSPRPGAAGRGTGEGLHACVRSVDDFRQGPDAAGRGPARCTADLSDIMASRARTRFKRPVYAGNAILTVEVPAGPKIVATVRTASFEAAPAAALRQGRIGARYRSTLPAHTRFVSLSSAAADRPDLQSARRVISGGRAFGSAEKFKLHLLACGQAWRCGRCFACRRRCGLRSQRSAGGSDRQDHRARASTWRSASPAPSST